jgi:tetratricopeptide (TPR) repeat protein
MRTRDWLAIVFALLLPMTALASGEESQRAFRAGKRAEEAGQKKAAREFYQRGIDVARRTLASAPNDPGALLWYTANLAAEALTHGKLYTLRVIPEVERTLLRLEQIAPMYDHAAAARVLGRLYHKAPAVISIGSNSKAADFLGRALSRAPEFPGNQAFAADFYNDRGDCARARPLAVRLRATPDLDRHGPDAKEWREIADEVLDDCPEARAR